MDTPQHPQGEPRENTVRLVTEAEAEGRVTELYDEVKAAREGDLDEELSLSKLWLLFGNDPELLEIFRHHIDYTYNGGSLPFELKSKVSLVVASVLQCEGCRFFHESALEHAGVDADTIEHIEDLEVREVGFSPQEEVILSVAQKAAEDPYSVTDDDLEALRDLGLSERELLELLDCVAFHVYTAVLQGIAGIVYPGMDRERWTSLP